MRDADRPSSALNVLGGPLQACCEDPATGYYRDGYCHTGPGDVGSHTVCARMTQNFLAFSSSQGNDLATPRADLQFSGLRAGDRWCLCVARWREALEAGVAPPVILVSTHIKALDVVTLPQLTRHAFDAG